MRTNETKEIEGFTVADTVLTQNSSEYTQEPVSKWPLKIKFRNKVLVKVYRPCAGRDSYRVAWKAGGSRQMKSFKTYSGDQGAKKFADGLVKELGNDTSVARLTLPQANDAQAALALINKFREETGQNLSLTTAVAECCEARKLLNGRLMGEVITGFNQTVATVVRMDIGEAVTEFLGSSEPLTRSTDGKRAQLSLKYAYNRQIQLRRFADANKGHAVCDLTKSHVDMFISTLGEQKSKSRNQRKVTSAKSRNHYRANIRQFLDWAVRKDYLPVNHRLGEADGLRPERTNTSETEFYTPAEFAALLGAAKDKLAPLRPLIAIAGFCGLRTAELLRLDWANVWHVKGHIEVTTGTAKTRARRLVKIYPALAAWLKPYRANKSGKLWPGHEVTFHQHVGELCQLATVKRNGAEIPVARKDNALRHSFCTYHLARFADENLTAFLSGNTPAVIHRHYKGLSTQADAVKWFAIKPEKSPRN